MSLYDDLGVETSDSKTEGWSKNFKLLQSQLQVKKAALTQAKVSSATGRRGGPRGGLLSCPVWTLQGHTLMGGQALGGEEQGA